MKKPPSQRDILRGLAEKHGKRKEPVCQAYAKAERDGAVLREKNSRNLSPEEYADRLWRDGIHKGWL